MHFNSLDYTVRLVPRYGYLPLIVGHDRSTGKTHELYRGEFKATAVDALHAALEMGDKLRSELPEIDEILLKAEPGRH